MEILSVKHVSFAIQGHAILQRVSFDVAKGEVVGLIGPNGSGKTTLFNILSGFLKAATGSIVFKGEDITHLSPVRRSLRGIGRVFQNFGIFREMTLEENVLVALEALPRAQRAALGHRDHVVRQTLNVAGLQGHAQKKAGSLSGGQMRLLEIARTLMCGKELFLLDEPTAGVSPKMTQQVSQLIGDLKKEGRTVIIIEHDLPFIRRICDRVIVLDVGQVVLTGTPEEVQKSKELREIYFGADPTS